ncbi:MAG: DUF5703 domain-containing protein [Phycisphaerales bacterium]
MRPFRRQCSVLRHVATLAGLTAMLWSAPASAFEQAPVLPDALPDALTPTAAPDDLAWLDEYNIVWDAPSANASESMPCGGHDVGLNVWVEDGEVLIYVQRSGSIAETNEYLKLGRIRLALEPNPFADVAGARFRQTLHLRDGHVSIIGQIPAADDGTRPAAAATIRIWTDTSDGVVHLTVESPDAVHADVRYENWRLTDESIPNSNRPRSFFTLHEYPGKVVLSADRVAHIDGGVRFVHRNPDDALTTDILIAQQGLEDARAAITDDLRGRTFGGVLTGEHFVAAGTSDGVDQTLPYRAWHLRSNAAATSHHVRLVSHIDQTPSLAAWERDLAGRVATKGLDPQASRQRSAAWWNTFWRRSRIVINPEFGDATDSAWRVGRNATLFRYQLGCNAYGEYPTRFNGGNFTYDASLVGGKGTGYGPDWRDWGGGVFTAQNQRLLYWPMLRSGDFDAILPQFELYRAALPGATARVRTHFGHDGAVFSEYANKPGLALGAGWGWASGSRQRGPEVELGDPRADGARSYREPVEPGVMANPAISYHWCSQLEHAFMMLEYRRYSGRSIAAYMPFIESSVIFFDEHYRMRQRLRTGSELGDDGRLVVFPSTAAESYRGATNPADAVSGLHACVDALLALPESELVQRDRTYYESLRAVLPELPFATVDGRRIMDAAASYRRWQPDEIPQLYPLFPFNRFELIRRDTDLAPIFRDTWNFGRFRKGQLASWHQDGIFLARMGMTDAAAAYTQRKLDDAPRRFPTFWGPGHDWVPDHNHGGSGLIGLQEMLMQTVDDAIILLPAWPAGWDVDFRLHAPRQTVVTGSVRDGTVVELEVVPAERRADVHIAGANPAPSR